MNCSFSFVIAITVALIYTTAAVINITAEERQLYESLMQYRAKSGAALVGSKRIPLSADLLKVARYHVRDLVENRPDTGYCNMHSWSNKGPWSPCCYPSDPQSNKCMWVKPKELSSYRSNGFEISAGGGNDRISVQDAMNAWEHSKPHRAVMLNHGTWQQHAWNAVGCSIYRGYAVCWFGEEQ